jgi:His/Glu/Gln/Arg/opine family amino acid ABC transporter permease subunit
VTSVGERLRAWVTQQTPLSWAVWASGTLALALAFGGTIVLLVAGGLTPHERLLATMQSSGQRVLLWTGITLGIAAIASSIAVYRKMPTKSSREATVAGGVLGVQAVLFAAAYLWFLAGKAEIFVRNFLNLEFLGDLGPSFVTGAKNTVILALTGQGFGILLGLFLGVLLLSKRRVVRAPARAYVNFFRGTPLLWQLIFFAAVIVSGFGLFPRNPFAIAIIILALNAGAYTAEIFRAGIQSIERGQMEAARSLGMSYGKSMRYVILPQAVRRVIPPLTNEFVILIKDTSLVSVLGLLLNQRELMAVGRDAYSDTFNATPLLGTALGYLVVTLPMIRVVSWLEKKLRSGLTGVAGM